ncbi:anhydro-N-acetylmuramic acid kinase [Echinicola strongylocentroti]|uniref:Anhydro-N-acetylmuramic acid kinase n=1 Tax=Echinicola strongylocentroti TaxID=1795355 RepID=A0A2Z4IH95_9BACT|nr:anhydro-N-acetylmuramic acid kinase [Echinicola strongylocentroti]AWW30521.1 anhydro-N-acetylmuramic acid kinase [Echinicola strongylocentroti]
MKSSDTYKAIGLMSGTSGDGLDIAHCTFRRTATWSFVIDKASTVPFPVDLGRRLGGSHLLSGEELALLDVDFGSWMGKCVRQFCQENKLTPDLVASHGHTVFHQPHKGMTLQIGSGWTLSQESNCTVINDFRSLDVSLGGQGAPLAPVGDHFLFPAYDFCLNLGGISNVSMMHNGKRAAFDVSPFNLLLNELARKKGLPYDRGGKMASAGTVNTTFLNQLNSVGFYQKEGAKSLGREEMESVFLPLLNQQEDTIENLLATLITHYTEQISKVIHHHPTIQTNKLLVTGGGAYNDYFIKQLQQRLGTMTEVVVPAPSIVEFKEAVIFAFLGVLKMNNEINTFGSVTGANRDSSGGVLYKPQGPAF